MRWAGHVLRMGEMKNLYNILVGKREGKRSFGKLCRLKNNIRMDLREIELIGFI
jgi:hypothetical protein